MQELGFSEGVLSEGDEALGGTRTVEIDESVYQHNEYNDFDQPVLTEVEDQNPDLDHDDPFENLENEASTEDARAAGPVYSIMIGPRQYVNASTCGTWDSRDGGAVQDSLDVQDSDVQGLLSRQTEG
eukprot:1416833-Rhodomonas_salina.1